MMRFDPALRICASIDACAPPPKATMTITAATPMIMPRAVSAVRITLRRSARTAIPQVATGDIASGLHGQCRLARIRRQVYRGVATRGDRLIETDAAVAEGDQARRIAGDVGLVRD